MRVDCKPLACSIALLAVMASAHAIDMKGKLYVQSPAAYSPDASFVRDIKDECRPEIKLAEHVRRYVGKQFSEVVPIKDPAEAGAGKLLVLTILEIRGVGGGAWSGSKGLTAEARLIEGGKQFGVFKDDDSSGGGMFGGFKGTCAILDRAAEGLAENIADWLAELKPGEGIAVAPATRPVAAAQTFEPCSASDPTFAGRDYVHAVLLLGPSDAKVHTAASALYHTGVRQQSMCDLLAEVTWTACAGKRTLDPDTLSWLGLALGTTRQSKYAGVLDGCIAGLGDGTTRSHLTEARAKLDKTSTASFQGGHIDLAAAYAQLKQQVATGSGARPPKGFETLRSAQSIDEVMSTLGLPDEIAVDSVSSSSVGSLFVRIAVRSDAIIARYTGQGAIRFVFREGSNDWRLFDATSEQGLLWMPEDGQLMSIEDRIANGSASQLRTIAERLLEAGPIDRQTQDNAANRIQRDRDIADEDLADGLAWLCKVLGQGKDGRYRSFLVDVSTTAKEEQLRKYAGRVAAGLPETSADVYVPAPR